MPKLLPNKYPDIIITSAISPFLDDKTVVCCNLGQNLRNPKLCFCYKTIIYYWYYYWFWNLALFLTLIFRFQFYGAQILFGLYLDPPFCRTLWIQHCPSVGLSVTPFFRRTGLLPFFTFYKKLGFSKQTWRSPFFE